MPAEIIPLDAKKRIAKILNEAFDKIEHLNPQINDLHSKDFWLNIIHNEKNSDAFEHFVMLAGKYAPTDEQLNQLGIAFPNLKEAIIEYKETLRE